MYNYTVVKRRGKKTVLVGGCFDLLHFGHFIFLKNAKAAGDYLIVALESDEFIKRQKKKNPIHNQRQRAQILKALNFVNKVILLPFLKTDDDYFEIIEKIKPNIIAVTENDPLINNKTKQAKKIGATLKIVTPLIKGFSTSKITKNFSL